MGGLVKFLKEARAELKKVSWPTWEDVNRSTVVVAITVVVFILVIYMADKAIKFALEKVLG